MAERWRSACANAILIEREPPFDLCSGPDSFQPDAAGAE